MKRMMPDDYFRSGPIEIARFGERVVMRNNMSSGQHKQFVEHIKAEYDSLAREIDEKVYQIRNKVILCNPIQLLSFLSDMGLMSFANKYSESEASSSDNTFIRATEYVQSILVSSPSCLVEHEDSDLSKQFFEILSDIQNLYDLIQNFIMCWGVKLEDIDTSIDSDTLKLMVEAQMMYLVRGKRYQMFEAEYYQKLLYVHDGILNELFGIASTAVIDGIRKLQYSLTQGKADAINQMHSLMEADEESFFIEHQGEAEELYNMAFGTQLRDVAAITGWPEVFLKEISWGINCNAEFFCQSQFSGWPIIDLPVFKRPFIEINGKYYCFDYYSFIDNFYRVLQKTITRLSPSYVWSSNQQIASEKLAKEVFQKLLPGCTIYNSNFYPLNGPSSKQLAENDLIVVYDNVLIIIEVKAGSFVYTPPITDFHAHIDSYKSLIEKADQQCRRTKDYLTQQTHAQLLDCNRKVKAMIDMQKITTVYMMSVTVDNINTFAAKAEKLNFLQSKSNAISIAIDDLMVYREFFSSPLLFLHFLQQRSWATQEPKLALNDELDHLGMYIKHNCYAFQADTIPADATGNYYGYRAELDNYFCKLYHPALQNEKPSLSIPGFFLSILSYLETAQIEKKSFIANYFLNFSSDAKDEFYRQIQYVIKRQQQLNQSVPICATGTGTRALRYVCFVNQLGIVEASFARMREYTLACLLRNAEEDRHLIDIVCDKQGNLIRVDLRRFDPQDIEGSEHERIRKLGDGIAKNRLLQYQKTHKGKVGRNQLCPCGSGKKYKNCCG